MKSRITTAVLFLVVAVLAIHVVGRVLDASRLDVTADDLYSLTPGTLDILQRMQDEGVRPVELDLYFSYTAGKTLPKFIKDFVTYERYLRNLLKVYQKESGGKIRVRFFDPVPDSDLAQDAGDFGLDGKPINQHGDLFYFGLVLQTQTGSREVIDFLWPNQQETVEYEITRRLYSLLWPARKRVGVLSSLEVMGNAENPYLAQMLAAQGKKPTERWMIFRLLEETHEVRTIDVDTDHISKDEFDLVVVIHPRGFGDKTLWALDEWIVSGGNTLILVDPYSLDDQPPQNPREPWAALQYKPASNLEKLFDAWGITRSEDQFAADLDLAVKRQVAARGPVENVVVDLALSEQNADATLNLSLPPFQGLGALRFFLAGELVWEERDGVEILPLVTTTAGGNTLEILPGFGGEEGLHFTDLGNAARLRDRFVPGTTPVTLGCLIQGRLPSAFPDGAEFPSEQPEPPPGLPPGVQLPPPEGAEMIRKDPVPDEERGESTVMVFSDVDFISNSLAFQTNFLGLAQTANDNHKLFLNAVDYLLGSQELMRVRVKKSINRPFELFDEIETEADKETVERERELRADVEAAQKELQEAQTEMTQRNASLFQKKVRDEVDALNEKIKDRNRELFEIRKTRRAALEREESRVRIAVMGWMPVLVLGVGLFLAIQRRGRGRRAGRS